MKFDYFYASIENKASKQLQRQGIYAKLKVTFEIVLLKFD